MTNPAAKVCEQVNKKCMPRNSILQLSIPYTYRTPQTPRPQNLDMFFIYLARLLDPDLQSSTSLVITSYRLNKEQNLVDLQGTSSAQLRKTQRYFSRYFHVLRVCLNALSFFRVFQR